MSEKKQPSEKRRRWTAKAKLEVVLEGLKGQESISEICRRHGITQSMYYEWQEAMLQGGEESLTHGGRSAREAELEKELRQAQRAIGRLTMENELYQKKNGVDRQTAEEVVAFYQREASHYPVELVCRVMGISRSAFYKALRRPVKRRAAMNAPDEQQLVDRIKALAKRFPDYGYRRIWALLRFGVDPIVINRKRVQRLMQLHGLQVKVKRYHAVRRPHLGRVEVNDSNLLWGIDLTKIWCGRDGWANLFAIVDHCDRECVGIRFSLNAKAERAREALDEAIATRFGSPQTVPHDLQIRADNGSQFGARAFLSEVDRLGMELTYTPYRSPQGNAIVERFFRSLKEECVWHHRFESFEQAEQVVTEWIRFYNDERMHSRLGYRSPRRYREIQTLRKNAA